MAQPVLFLDDGGVLSDNNLRAPQWQRLVGVFLAPRLGGAPAAWAEANLALTDRLFAPGAWDARLSAAPDYATFERTYLLDWLGGMCSQVGVPLPPAAEALALAREAETWIVPQVQAALPGAPDAVRTLHAAGFVLHTASGESSRQLAGYLTAMGVRACFGRLYGPDLVDAHKIGPDYYARLFADVGVAPEAALVIDDSPAALAWAAATGATTALVGAAPGPLPAGAARVAALADLPALLQRWG